MEREAGVGGRGRRPGVGGVAPLGQADLRGPQPRVCALQGRGPCPGRALSEAPRTGSLWNLQTHFCLPCQRVNGTTWDGVRSWTLLHHNKTRRAAPWGPQAPSVSSRKTQEPPWGRGAGSGARALGGGRPERRSWEAEMLFPQRATTEISPMHQGQFPRHRFQAALQGFLRPLLLCCRLCIMPPPRHLQSQIVWRCPHVGLPAAEGRGPLSPRAWAGHRAADPGWVRGRGRGLG